MIKIEKYDKKGGANVFIRRMNADPRVTASVAAIVEDVKERGDEAVREYSLKFDGWAGEMPVSESEWAEGAAKCDAFLLQVMKEAAQNIADFHRRQIPQGFEIEKENGVILGQKVTPLERVGIYVPGGTAAYPSTVLMNAVPASVAGVKEIIMVTPAKEGRIKPEILAAAKIAGVTKIFKVGGAQAIAALAYGTQTIPAVDKITGPGNIYVATAKKLVYGQVDIDMIAGPSEILVIADESADAERAAADARRRGRAAGRRNAAGRLGIYAVAGALRALPRIFCQGETAALRRSRLRRARRTRARAVFLSENSLAGGVRRAGAAAGTGARRAAGGDPRRDRAQKRI